MIGYSGVWGRGVVFFRFGFKFRWCLVIFFWGFEVLVFFGFYFELRFSMVFFGCGFCYRFLLGCYFGFRLVVGVEISGLVLVSLVLC